MPSKKKKYNSRFPPARIKKIMQTDEDVGKVAAAVPVIISRSLELFIESLILKSNATTQSRKAKTLSTAHIKHTIVSERKFDFLKDLVADVPDVQQADDDSGDGQPSNSHSETSTGRPRGRPRKKKAEGETEPPKRRPRKEKIESDDSATEDADSDGNGDESTESDDEQPDPQTSNAHRGAPGPLSTPAFRDLYQRPDSHGNSIPEPDLIKGHPGHLTDSACQGGVDRNSLVGTSASCPTDDSHNLTTFGKKNNNCFRLPGTSGFTPMAPPMEPMPYMHSMYHVPAHPPPQLAADDDYDS